jgi:site-specific DNA-methyltransferase (adenine-specific)
MIDLYLGDCLEKLKELQNNSVDSVVTDPPAGIGFMGKAWDKDKGGRDH